MLLKKLMLFLSLYFNINLNFSINLLLYIFFLISILLFLNNTINSLSKIKLLKISIKVYLKLVIINTISLYKI